MTYTVGCTVYQTLINEHVFCGMTCLPDCAAYCQTVANGVPDPSLIDPQCDQCTNTFMGGEPDLDAFLTACQSDPSCTQFVGDPQGCPN